MDPLFGCAPWQFPPEGPVRALATQFVSDVGRALVPPGGDYKYVTEETSTAVAVFTSTTFAIVSDSGVDGCGSEADGTGKTPADTTHIVHVGERAVKILDLKILDDHHIRNVNMCKPLRDLGNGKWMYALEHLRADQRGSLAAELVVEII